MFIYKLNSWIDKYDPYWFSRFVSIKAVYITIIMFTANLLLNFPSPPLLYMIIAIISSLIIEMPTINTFKKKDSIFLLFTLLSILTISIFSLQSYLKLWLVVFCFSWSYVIYSLFKKQPSLFPIVSLIILMGVMSLESNHPATLNSVFNQALFYFEMSMIAFWGHKLFPNFYIYNWKSAILRCVECQVTWTKTGNFNYKAATKHLTIARLSLPLLSQRKDFRNITEFTKEMTKLNFLLADQSFEKQSSFNIGELKSKVLCLHSAIIKPEKFLSSLGSEQLLDSVFLKLKQNWEEICLKN